MDRNRLLGVLLFSIAGLIVWFSFLIIMGGFELSFDTFTLGGASLALITSSLFSFIFYPNIKLALEKSSAYYISFSYGVFITFLSYLLGSFCFGTLISWNLTITEGIEMVSIAIFFSMAFLSPGFLIGGFTGVLVCFLIKRTNTKIESIKE